MTVAYIQDFFVYMITERPHPQDWLEIAKREFIVDFRKWDYPQTQWPKKWVTFYANVQIVLLLYILNYLWR